MMIKKRKLGQKRKDSKLISKIMMYTLLITIVLGFTIPVLDFGDESSNGQTVEQRICQTDSDCYLICDDLPVEVFCSQNLCKQNSCSESSLYPFQESGLVFSLVIESAGEKVDSVVRDGDLFVVVDGDKVSLHTEDLSFGHVLEKLGYSVDPEQMELTVNDEKIYSIKNYLVQENDVVKLVIG